MVQLAGSAAANGSPGTRVVLQAAGEPALVREDQHGRGEGDARVFQEEWLEFGEGKIIYWALEHSRAINDKQRTYWKRKLDNYARWDKQHATIAEKYISMLVQG